VIVSSITPQYRRLGEFPLSTESASRAYLSSAVPAMEPDAALLVHHRRVGRLAGGADSEERARVRASASSIAIVERIAVGVVKKFAARWRERKGVAGFPGERWRRLRA